MSKINSGTVVLGFLAILFGLIGTWAFREYTKKPVAVPSVEVAPGKVTVPMASRTLEPGHQIKVDDIALVKLTREELKENGFNNGFMSNAAQIVGKTVKTEIQRGKTFDTREFYPDGTGPGIADRLKPGQRAVTVSLTPTNALIGFAGAGQVVDVLFHYGEQRKAASEDNEPQTATGSRPAKQDQFFRSATVTLVQNAEILALGNRAVQTENANGISTQDRVLVTLAVSPEDAEAIRVADGNGELSLSLRNPEDQSTVQLGAPRMLSQIINIDSGVRQMEIYRGTRMTKVEFNTRANGIPTAAVIAPQTQPNLPEEPADLPEIKTLRSQSLTQLSESIISSTTRPPSSITSPGHNNADEPQRSLLDSRRSTRASTRFGIRR